MSLRILLLTAFTALGLSGLHAQGVHFTQYNLSPLTLNPALSGKYEGTFRLGGIVRDQWRSVVSSSAYQTQSLYIDSPLLRGFKRKDWIGLGVMAFNDVRSVGKLTTTAFNISGAYHLALDGKGSNVLSIGGQYSNNSRDVTDNFLFEEEIKNPTTPQADPLIPSGASGQMLEANFNTWNAGVLLSSKLNKTTDVQVGLSFGNITRPQSGFAATGGTGGGGGAIGQSKIARNMTLHGKFDAHVNKKVTISPSFLFQTAAKQDEIIIQALAGYLWDEKRDLTLNAGLSYRLADAISPMLGARYKKFTLGVAYDVRVGQVLNSATGGRGGIEIGAYYIQKIYKQPKVKTKILCPRF